MQTMWEFASLTGPLFWPLLLCSVIACALIVERIWRLVQVWRTEFRHRAPRPLWQEAQTVLAAHAHVDRSLRDDAASLWVSQRRYDLHRGLRWLGLIGAVSPLLGLLGTVFGLIDAFGEISNLPGAVKPAAIADGLWQAMLTTAIGLAIAIPALVAQFLLRGVADSFLESWIRRLNHSSIAIEMESEQGAARRANPPQGKAA
jgi:biopolymer transport protein ExbB